MSNQLSPAKINNHPAFRHLPAWLLVPLALVLAACGPRLTTVPPQPATLTSPPPDTQTVPVLPTQTTLPSPTSTSIYLTDLPDPSAYQWTSVASGLDDPVDIQNGGDGSGRLFIVERAGDIRILRDGQLLPTPFLDIRDRSMEAELLLLILRSLDSLCQN